MTEKQRVIEHLSKLDDSINFKQIEDAVFKLNPNPIWKNIKGRWFFAFAGIFAVISFFILFHGIDLNKQPYEKVKEIHILDGIIYTIWLIIPPLWFLYEYVWLFDDKYKLQSNQQADFKLTYELASKFWAALLILFGLVIYLKYGYKP